MKKPPKLPLSIGPLDVELAQKVSQLIAETIRPLEYYSERARAEEIEKYGLKQLLEMARHDPDSVLVAYIEDQPMGFCISRYDDGLLWLAWFGVDPTYRGRGVADALLQALAKTLQNRRAHKIWCDTRTDNRHSQRVLERFGFIRVAHLKNHWYGHNYFLWEWSPDN